MGMTGDQYDALVKVMRGDAGSAGNRAARRVLVDGKPQAERPLHLAGYLSLERDFLHLAVPLEPIGSAGLEQRQSLWLFDGNWLRYDGPVQ